MNLTASKFNKRVKNIVTGLLILCIIVNAILWVNGISYSYIYKQLYNPSKYRAFTRQANIPVRIDKHVTASANNVKPSTIVLKPRDKKLSVTTKAPVKLTLRPRPKATTPSKQQKESQSVKTRPWLPFDIPEGIKIKKVKWNVSDSAPLCKVKDVGPVFVPWSIRDLTEEVKTRYAKPYPGGLWTPPDCKAIAKVAIMVPYRNRPQNLEIFSHHMHYFLQKQCLDYALFVIEQVDKKKFNRAKLFNIGYIFTQLMHEYDCLVLHDIDKIPEDTSYSYACSKYPTHLPGYFRKASDGRHRHKYFSSHYYRGFFGGVSSLRKEHWAAINGMVNDYWGWGGEDDELFMRLVLKKFHVKFARESNSKFVILYHKPDAVYSHRPMPKRRRVQRTMFKNGLNSLKFELVNISYKPLFTHIEVKL